MQRKKSKQSPALPLQSPSRKEVFESTDSQISSVKKDKQSNEFRRSKLLLLRLRNQWRILLIVSAILILANNIILRVIPGSYRTPQFRDQTIKIPMEGIPEGREPMGLPLRLLDNLKRRKTGNEAIVRYAQDVRNLISFGKDILLPENSEQKERDPQKESLFRQRIFEMAPWLLPTSGVSEFANTVYSPGKAILICAGNHQIEYLKTLLYTIRKIHESPLPIYLSFRGDEDLSPIHQKNITSRFAAVHPLDLTHHFDLDTTHLHGWNLRMFGALLVPETEVIMLDADVLLFRPPEDLFQMQGYKETGALFFHDRMGVEWLWTPRQFIHRVQPFPSQQISRAMNSGQMNNEHIIESGVVLIDKSRRLLGIWTACLLLGRWDLRRFAQTNYIFGDKEFYIAAMELIQEPYAMSRFYPGVIGNVFTDFQQADIEVEADGNILEGAPHELSSQMALCGRLLHFDDSGMPLWSNGGYLTKADDFESEQSISKAGLKPFYYIDGGDSETEQGQSVHDHQFGQNQNWRFNFRMGVNCLFPNARKARQVPYEDVSHGLDAVRYYTTAARQ